MLHLVITASQSVHPNSTVQAPNSTHHACGSYGVGGFSSLRLHLERAREDGEPHCFSQARGPNIGPNGILALPEVCGSWHPAALLPSTPALQKLGHQETPGAGMKMVRGQRTENRDKRGAAGREAVHPQESAVSRVYFWQEGNHCKPLD